MKSPDEIKNALKCCATLEPIYEPCGECSYAEINYGVCSAFVCADAIAYIQQLEREKDAAVEDLESGVCCATCLHADTDAKEPPCATCRDAYAHGNWEWRGVQEVE